MYFGDSVSTRYLISSDGPDSGFLRAELAFDPILQTVDFYSLLCCLRLGDALVIIVSCLASCSSTAQSEGIAVAERLMGTSQQGA